jgi:hypothetical protein
MEPPVIDLPVPAPEPGGGVDFDIGDNGEEKLRGGGVFVVGEDGVVACPPNAWCEDQPSTSQQVSFGFPRDTFWPKSALAFVLIGITLTLASAQLVSPTRRLRIRLPHFSRRGNQTAVVASDSPPTGAVAVDQITDEKVEIS